jgi:flagellar basal body-associated protein FliL
MSTMLIVLIVLLLCVAAGAVFRMGEAAGRADAERWLESRRTTKP